MLPHRSPAASFVVRSEGASKEAMIGSMIRTIVNIVLDPVMISGFPTAIFSVLMSVSTIVLNQVLVVYGNAPVAAIAGLNGVIYGQALTDIISILLSIVSWIKCRKRI